MFDLQFLTLVKFSHLLALAIALGTAIAADYVVLTRAILKPIDRFTIDLMHFLSILVALGLGGLWITGIFLALEIQLQNPLFYTNQKFWAKVFIVVVLTVNAFVIHTMIMSKLVQQEGKRLFQGLGSAQKLTFCIVGGVSFTSWMYPTILGLAKELSYKTPGVEIMAWYYLTLLLAIAGVYAVAVFSTHPILARLTGIPYTSSNPGLR